MVLGVLTAVYTAFLFAQARGRDFWQSPLLALHMLTNSALTGGAMVLLLTLVGESELQAGLVGYVRIALVLHDLHPMQRIGSKSTMPSGRMNSEVTGQISTQGGFAQWLQRRTEKTRCV